MRACHTICVFDIQGSKEVEVGVKDGTGGAEVGETEGGEAEAHPLPMLQLMLSPQVIPLSRLPTPVSHHHTLVKL